MLQLIVIKGVAVLAGGLDLVHRHVGVLDQCIDIVRIVGKHRDSDTDVDVDFLAAQIEGLLQARDELLGDAFGLEPGGGLRQ